MSRPTIRVSIVEDDSAIRETLRSLFIFEDGMEAFTVHSTAEDAMLRLVDTCPDVVVMDINLPGASGIDCVRQMSQRCTAAQFLMYTVHDDDHRVFEALKAGANGYILKSSTPDEILAAVRELHAGGSPMSAHVARRVVAHLRPQRGAVVDTGLTEREQQVLALLADGLLYKEIGDKLGITTGTIKQHIHRMYEKLHVQNRTEAVNRFFGR
ncbi:MAG: response regulator transcription factor [Bacteroidetes bacterium]|nr:response regulator transcription factor [Bacteroidota bacterium]MBX7127807.1 response regulator transcription factor [Flavobacteriales bacterium]MCC6656358.1 response regulator transcription factor [Flavobacteriales bacterium]HMU12595.1 response regulator transcription factor [Flavobacteriales bacterium]HMW98533.1 response regulator transcription factor [Flavobacteriales bacterium]